MLERKMYKTKLCVLYQKGYCHRHSCNFAHGDAERRRFSGPFEGRRDYRPRDLREKLNRRYSPPRRYPLRRDISGRHASHGDSPSGSLEKRSDTKDRKRQHPDDQSDLSGSLQISNETHDHLKEKKCLPYDSKHTLKLRQLQSEIKKLDDRKNGLEVYLEDRSLEAEKLALKVEELEVQLFKEKDECKRITSRIKKFIEAHKHLSRLQDEVKRSDGQLRKLGDKLLSSANPNGDDLSINYSEMKKKKRSEMRRNAVHVQLSNEKKVKADTVRTNGGFEHAGNEVKLPSTGMAAHAVDEDGEMNDDPKLTSFLPPPPPLPISKDSYSQFKGEDENVDIDGVDEETTEVDIV